MFNQECPDQDFAQPLYTVIDPAAGGPQSEYAIVTVTRHKGLVTVLPLRIAVAVLECVHE